MAYQVLALKYRPRRFDDVVGQEAIVTTLRNALRERRIAHGYIFSGVRGVGKTTLARIFARALNCAASDGPTPDPCGECGPCREILEGRSLDVYEIDGASNSGVDKMRELLEMARYSPAASRYKVFIIDEFHQISRTAFNALLKTLEEPPAHVVFIMATTEIAKVLPTILSRCQVFDMRRIRPTVISARLKEIAQAESIEIGPRALALLARSAGGSMRDALTAMDQVVAACGNTVRDEEARAVLGVIPEEEVDAFFERLAERDAAGMLRLIAQLADAGYDVVGFGAELHHAARRLLCARTLPDVAAVLDLSEEEAERARKLAGLFGEDELLRILNAIEEAQGPLRYSAQPRFLLEAVAVRLARLGDLVAVEELLARMDSGEALPAAAARPAIAARTPALPPPASRPTPAHVPAPAPASTKKKLQAASDVPPSGPAPEASAADPEAPAADTAVPSAPAAHAAPLPEEAGLFERVLERLEAEYPALQQAVVMAEKPIESGGVLTLPFPERSIWRKRVEEAANLAILQTLATELAGRPVSVRVANRSGPAPQAGATATPAGPQPAVARPAPPATSPAAPPPPPARPGAPATRAAQDALEDPVFRSVAEIFQARVLEVRDNTTKKKDSE